MWTRLTVLELPSPSLTYYASLLRFFPYDFLHRNLDCSVFGSSLIIRRSCSLLVQEGVVPVGAPRHMYACCSRVNCGNDPHGRVRQGEDRSRLPHGDQPKVESQRFRPDLPSHDGLGFDIQKQENRLSSAHVPRGPVVLVAERH
jgi:hypothetical protein